MKNQTKLMRVLVGCLLALFLFTGQGTALAEENSFIGKTVTKVAVTGNRLITDPDILAAVKLKAGQPLTAEAVRTDLHKKNRKYCGTPLKTRSVNRENGLPQPNSWGCWSWRRNLPGIRQSSLKR